MVVVSPEPENVPTSDGVVVAFEDYAPKFFDDDDDNTSLVDDTNHNNNNNIITVELRRHKPSLGCTVEESLADPTLLLVSSIVPDGYADTAGLRVGDVVTGLTGLFGLVESTNGMDLAALRTLVASRSPDQPLVMQVLRGSSAWADHERALTDLCSNVDDEKVEQCIAAFMQDAYDDDHNMDARDDDGSSVIIAVASSLPSSDDDKTTSSSSGTEEEAAIVAAADNLIDSMYNLWAAELPTTPPPTAPVDEESTVAHKIKPWSVRSSPSGTYVRDPVTGEMKNITQ